MRVKCSLASSRKRHLQVRATNSYRKCLRLLRVNEERNYIAAARVSRPLAPIPFGATNIPYFQLHGVLLHDFHLQAYRRRLLGGVRAQE